MIDKQQLNQLMRPGTRLEFCSDLQVDKGPCTAIITGRTNSKLSIKFPDNEIGTIELADLEILKITKMHRTDTPLILLK